MKTKFLLSLCLLGLGLGNGLAVNDYDTAFSCRFSPDTENPWDDQDWSTMNSTWEIIDANGDGNTWTFNRGTGSSDNDADANPFGGWVQYKYHSANKANDYLVTRHPINLTRQITVLNFSYKTLYGESFSESFAILFGETPIPTQMDTVYYQPHVGTSKAWHTDTISFSIEQAGDYYIAIHASSEPDRGTLYIDNIRILSSGEILEPAPDPEPEPTGKYPSLIISEYVEGSSYNKALELYNGTGHSIDLSAYTLMKQTNGRGDYGSPLTLEGTLGNKECYVIAHSGAVEELQSLADLSSRSQCLDFNGNDAVALFKNGIKIDVVGLEGSSEDWGKDVTLRRLPGLGPDSTYKPSQWETCPQNDFSGLGVHGETYANFDSIQTFENQMNRLALHFSGELEEESASNTANYQLSGGIEILSATLTGENNCVLLETSPMEGETSYTLTATNLKDILGNTLDPITIDFVSAVEGKIALTAQNFPDANFRNFLSEHFDSDHDGYLSEEECLEVKSIRTTETESRFASLEGLAFFPNLDTLTVAHSTLSSLDITSNTLLRHLDVSFTGLSALDASQNALLETLICSHNALESLDLENNTQLQKLDCQENSLAELNLNHNPLLQYLDCQNNQIQHLEISANTALDTLLCANNQIESLDLTANAALRNLDCSYNNLIFLDLSSNPELENVVCTNNRRYMEINSDNNTLDLNSIPGFDMGKASHWMGSLVDGNTLTFVTETATYQYENGFTGGEGSALPTSFEFTLVASNFNPDLPDPTAIPIDATNFPDDGFREFITYNLDQNEDGTLSQWEIDAVTKLNLNPNFYIEGITPVAYIFSLDGIEYFQNLAWLDISNQAITSIALTDNPNLKTLIMNTEIGGYIHSFFLSPAIQLDSLKVSGIDFSFPLNLSEQTNLRYVIYRGENNPEIDLSQCNKLTYLDCASTAWKNLDLSQHPDLQHLDCSGTQIQSLDLTNNMNLQYLDCSGTAITGLDLSRNLELQYLDCSGTKITGLDLRQNKDLKHVNCAMGYRPSDGTTNALKELLLDNPALQVLDCRLNRFTFLDLSRVPALQTLNCATNNFNELDLSQSPSLQDLDCSNNKLMDLTLGKQDSLRRLICSNNEIKTLDVNQCPSLQELYCSDVPIQVLDLTQNPKLKILECDRTALAGLDLSQNPELSEFSCLDIRIEVPVDANYSFDMGSLSGFQPERTSAWSGGVLDGSRATFSSAQASYQYNTGAAYASMRFMPVTVDVINFDEPGVAQLIPIDAEHFPDAGFRTGISNQFDANGNGWLSQAEIDNAVEFRFNAEYTQHIYSLRGIEHFPNLRVLDLRDGWGYSMDSLDLSQNLLLEEVNCSNVGLVFLDISQNAALKDLSCSNNNLTSLNLSGNPVLEFLNCSNNDLTSLDLSKNPALQELGCDGNSILCLDLSENQALRYVWVSSRINVDENNQIDLAKWPDFSVADASDWENTVVDGSLLTFLKPYASYHYQTGNPELGRVRFSIDVENFTDNTEDVLAIDTEHFPEAGFRDELLNPVYDWNQNGFFSQKELEALTVLSFSGWEIYTLEGIGHLAYLQSLVVTSLTDLQKLDLSNNLALRYLDCSRLGSLEELDLGANTVLEYLDCSDARGLKTLDVSQNIALEHLNCARTDLTSLDVSQNKNLRYLDCSGEFGYGENYGPGQQLVELQLPSSLDTLICSGLLMTSLDLGQVPSLVCLICDNSRFETLDLSQNPALRHFSCSNGVLSSLDLSQNPALEIVECFYNQRYVTVDEYNRFDLDTLPGFNLENAFDWYFATPSGSILTFPDPEIGDFDESMVSYTYRTGTPVADADFAEIEFSLIASNYNDEILESDTNGLAINAVHFPDSIFREYVRNHFDLNASGYLGDREIQRVREIEVEGLGIKSLQGIEMFLNLHDLLCSGNQLTELDLRENKNLDFLDCSANRLDTLLLSGVLTSLYCERNQLESLDLDSLPMLTVLSCSNNRLKELDLSANTCLDVLRCSYNNLVSLDLSRNNGLDVAEYFECVGNKRVVEVGSDNRFDLSTLSGFDLSRASRWVGAELEGNILKFNEKQVSYSYYTASVYTDLGTDTVTFSLEAENFHPGDQPQPDTGLLVNSENFPDSIFHTYVATVFDKDGNGELSDAEIQDATVVNVDGLGIENLEGIGFLAALRELYCSNNHLVSLDLTANPQLETLSCKGNQRHLILENNTFDLSSLPMDISRTSNWTNAELEGSVLTFLSDTIYYDYNLGYIGANDIPSVIRFCLTGNFQTGNADREASNIRVYAHDMTIYIQNASDEIEIYSAKGVLQYKGHKTQIEMMTQGLYIVRHKGRSWKIMVM